MAEVSVRRTSPGLTPRDPPSVGLTSAWAANRPRHGAPRQRGRADESSPVSYGGCDVSQRPRPEPSQKKTETHKNLTRGSSTPHSKALSFSHRHQGMTLWFISRKERY